VSRRGKKRVLGVSGFLHTELARYDVTQFPEDILYRDKVASILGAPMDGWTPELVFRYAICQPLGLNVDWAIMTYARRVEGGGSGPRRRVERIDICESEVHVHRFRISNDPDDDQGERRTIVSLYAGDEATVSRQWDIQMQLLSREWPQRMERWLDG
jgi:hypothetical protein